LVEKHEVWRLYARCVNENNVKPHFSEAVRQPRSDEHFVASISPQCPFNLYWGKQVVSDLQAHGHLATLEHQTSAMDAHQVASPLGTYSLERDGQLYCHHLTTTNATRRMLSKRGLLPAEK